MVGFMVLVGGADLSYSFMGLNIHSNLLELIRDGG